MAEAAEKLRAHFASGRVVCPFARSSEIVFFHWFDDLHRRWEWFFTVRDHRIAVVHFDDRERDFDSARDWCHAHLELLARSVGADTTHGPFFHVGDTTFFVIGMGPQYPAHHPRYAPVLCLVAVNEADIRQVPERVREAIRRAMIERTGVVYDADNVWLPLEPRAISGSRSKESP